MALAAVFTTVATREDARRLARGAVDAHHAACAQISAIDSVYRWEGTVHEEAEFRLLFKTTEARRGALCRWLRANHPYRLPAIYTLAVADADGPYEQWVEEGCVG